jgi:hypothetical protein
MPAQKQSLQNEDPRPTPQMADVEFYDRFIWAIAREITHSREEAEAAALEILREIERFAMEADPTRSRDEYLESVIAWRKLLNLAGEPGH